MKRKWFPVLFLPLLLAAEDPFLKRTKLFAENWNEVMDRRPKKGYITPGDGPVSVAEKNLAEYNMQFMEDMRRFLKGDEGMLQAFEFRSRRNPAEYAVVNYMANTNGFTLMDAVSYDRKHNEKNGEENRDGSDYNYSWNCGAERPTRKKKIVELSGGNQQKCIVARWISTDPRVLMLDEPTKGIDVGAKSEFYQMICQFAKQGLGVILISSELPEVMGLSDRIIVMRARRIVGEISAEDATESTLLSMGMIGEVKEA